MREEGEGVCATTCGKLGPKIHLSPQLTAVLNRVYAVQSTTYAKRMNYNVNALQLAEFAHIIPKSSISGNQLSSNLYRVP